MRQLLPHLQRALQIRSRLGGAERKAQISADVLDGLAVGIVVTDAGCRIVFSNQIAESTLRAEGGLSVKGGRLRPRSAKDEAIFDRAIENAAGRYLDPSAPGAGALVLRARDNQTLSVLVTPMPPDSMRYGQSNALCAVIFSAPMSKASLRPRRLAERFGLTPAQARLLAALADGTDLAGYAHENRIGLVTVRTHLKELLVRTGQHRQVDLVRLVLADPLLRLKVRTGD